MRFAAGAFYVDPDRPDHPFPVHAFESTGEVATVSVCGRVDAVVSPTDLSLINPGDFLDEPSDGRCAFCSSVIDRRRAAGEPLEPLAHYQAGAAEWADRIGAAVAFRYADGLVETGVVTSVNARFVFVRFHRPDGELKTTSEACEPSQLTLCVDGEIWR